MNSYSMEVYTRQTHFFYEAFESKNEIKKFKEMIEDEEDIEDFLLDYVYENPQFITPSFGTTEFEIYDAKGEEIDSFPDSKLQKKQISRQSAIQLNNAKKALRGYILFVEVLKTSTTTTFETKEPYNRDKFEFDLIDYRYKIGPSKYGREQEFSISYDGKSVDLSDLGDGSGTRELKLGFFDDAGKRISVSLDEPDKFRSTLERLC